jgi:hypothetical protein
MLRKVWRYSLAKQGWSARARGTRASSRKGQIRFKMFGKERYRLLRVSTFSILISDWVPESKIFRSSRDRCSHGWGLFFICGERFKTFWSGIFQLIKYRKHMHSSLGNVASLFCWFLSDTIRSNYEPGDKVKSPLSNATAPYIDLAYRYISLGFRGWRIHYTFVPLKFSSISQGAYAARMVAAFIVCRYFSFKCSLLMTEI